MNWVGMATCAVMLLVVAASVSFAEGLADLPDRTWQPTPRVPRKMIVPTKTETVSETENRHTAMVNATRGTKTGLIAGRQPEIEVVALTDPEHAAERLEASFRDKRELVLKSIPVIPKSEFTVETLADESKAD